MPRIPIIEDLTASPVPAGSILLVEFTGASQWFNAALIIAAGWLKQGGRVSYNAYLRSPENVRSKLSRAGLNVETLEAEDKLRIWDWYTTTLGKKSNEKFAYDSLKVADLSIRFAQLGPSYQLAGWIRINDNISTIARFNDEKAWIEFLLTRAFPGVTSAGKTTTLLAILKGVHSNSAYEQLEAASDGVIDFRLEEVTDKVGEQATTIIRIRSMRDTSFDARWHRLKIEETLEFTLEK
jgi:KaiC/GvpD/RAD55 family RecA-like ATPase